VGEGPDEDAWSLNAAVVKWRARFGRDERGGIVVMGALVLLPLTMLSFAAVEFSRYTTIRSHLQDGLDAATLAASRALPRPIYQLQRWA
jgi:Flp pilus assembly protein TadG